MPIKEPVSRDAPVVDIDELRDMGFECVESADAYACSLITKHYGVFVFPTFVSENDPHERILWTVEGRKVPGGIAEPQFEVLDLLDNGETYP